MFARKLILPVVSPFRLDLTVWALRRREKNTMELWGGLRYTRIAVFDDRPVRIDVAQREIRGSKEIVAHLHSVQEISEEVQACARLLIRKIFGLTVDLQPFYAMANGEARLKPLAERFRGLKPPRFPNVFEALVNAIACQQITLDVGILFLNRLTENFGVPFLSSGTMMHAFPRPEDLADVPAEEIKKSGTSHQKAKAIKHLAASICDKAVDFTVLEQMTNNEAAAYLSAIPGIGRWSAEYALLRGLGRLDIFPGDDVGAARNLMRIFSLDAKPTYDEIGTLTHRWHPYEGLVYFRLFLEKIRAGGLL